MVDEKPAQWPLGGFLFPNIFRSFRMAILPSRLAIAFAAVAAIWLTGTLMDLSRTVIVTGQGGFSTPTWSSTPRRIADTRAYRWTTELDTYMVSEARLEALLQSTHPDHVRTGVFRTLWDFAATHFHAAMLPFDRPGPIECVIRCLQALTWAFQYHTIYSVVFFTIVLVVLSLAGGAICRLTALQFAQGKRLRVGQGWRFSRTRVASFLAAPIGPLVIALLLGVPLIALGALGNIPIVGEILTGLLLPLSLVVAPFIAVLLIGAVAGLNLMYPAIAYEGSDFFDAISRSFSSLYAKPWRMGFYTLTAAVYGAVCYLFVRFFAFLLLWVTWGFLELGLRHEKLLAIWPEPGFENLFGTPGLAPETWSLWLAALLIRIWVLVIVGLVASFVVSFYFSASTVIYALMRNRVDGTPLDEVYEVPEDTADSADLLSETPPDQVPEPPAGTSA